MDWSLCAVCQTDTGEIVRCPLDAAGITGDIYVELLARAAQFATLGHTIVAGFDPSEHSAETWTTQRAKWHSSCRLLFALDRLLAAKQREELSTPRISRRQAELWDKRKWFSLHFRGRVASENLQT